MKTPTIHSTAAFVVARSPDRATTAAVSLLAALLPLSGCSPPPAPAAAAGPEAPVRVKTVTPTRGPFQRTTAQPLPFQAAPYEKADLFAKAAGYLDKIADVPGPYGSTHPLDIGDRVTAGQVLAELRIPEAQQDLVQKEKLLAQAETERQQAAQAVEVATKTAKAAADKVAEVRAQVDYARAEEDYRKSEYERYFRLQNERTASAEQVAGMFKQYQSAAAATKAAEAAVLTAQSNADVEQAKVAKAQADLKNAGALVEVATANRDQAKILLDYGRVTAPFAGVVTRRWVDTGAFIQSAAATAKPEPLFTLMRTDRPMRIVADVSEADAALIRLGQPATLQVNGGNGPAWRGTVVRFADALDPTTRTMRTEVEIDESRLTESERKARPALRPGTFGSLTIVLADYPDALLLDTSVLATGGGKTSVWVVEDGRAKRRDIEVGYNNGVRVHVTGNLKSDDQVISDGKNLVHEGQAVEVVK